MKEKLRFLGLDVHAETIAVAIAEPDGEVRGLGTIPNRAESLRKLIKKLGPTEKLRVCYEAGPTGYVTYWQLAVICPGCCSLCPRETTTTTKTPTDSQRLTRSLHIRAMRSSNWSAGRFAVPGGLSPTLLQSDSVRVACDPGVATTR